MRRSDGAIRLDRLHQDPATLQVSGRISNLDLADKVGLSATPCMQRVKRWRRQATRRLRRAAQIDKPPPIQWCSPRSRCATTVATTSQVRARHPDPAAAPLLPGDRRLRPLAQFSRDIRLPDGDEDMLDATWGSKYFATSHQAGERSVGYPLAALLPSQD
jgi:hypothetical protein